MGLTNGLCGMEVFAMSISKGLLHCTGLEILDSCPSLGMVNNLPNLGMMTGSDHNAS